jgi:acetyl-CoA carboxylase beta subunit/acetyl-CoA carboxylase alpha subunit
VTAPAASRPTRGASAQELLGAVLDPGSFVSWDAPVDYSTQSEPYRGELERAAERSGADEAVITGEGRIGGRRVALAVSEFGFLAGSIGLATANRLVQLFERATAEGLPVLASPASGGTRMQEGTPAFVAMVKITAAVRHHKQARLPYLVYLRHPTTGGVMASWGSLGHVTVAEPGALLGFLGPRVYEALYDAPFPEGVQVSENLYAHGLIDAVVPVSDLAAIVDRALSLLDVRRGTPQRDAPGPTAGGDPLPGGAPATVWESIQATRHPRRPGIRHLLKYAATDVLQLNGTAQGERDARMFLALARFDGNNFVVIGQDRHPSAVAPPMGPAFLREARRGMRLAEELGLPLVTVIDTEGAALSVEAENGGIAGEIARSISDLIGLRTPTVSVLLGQGTGGGALALLPADRTIAAANAWLSPLPPEGASAIRYRTADRAAEMAERQHVDSASLLGAGIVDRVVPEPEDAVRDPRAFSLRIADAVAAAMEELGHVPIPALLAGRERKYGGIG